MYYILDSYFTYINKHVYYLVLSKTSPNKFIVQKSYSLKYFFKILISNKYKV